MGWSDERLNKQRRRGATQFITKVLPFVLCRSLAYSLLLLLPYTRLFIPLRMDLENQAFAACVVATLSYLQSLKRRKKKRTRNRSCWTKDWLLRRESLPNKPLLNQICENNPADYRNFLQMDDPTFQELLQLVTPYIEREDTFLRRAIPAEQRLVATLRFLATGRSLADLKFSTLISPQALGLIIPETCQAIVQVLKEQYLKMPSTTEEWLDIAQDFEDRWNFPNCGGAIGGKHVCIMPPPNSGSYFYNYKGFFSIILMAIVNANYEFIFVDVGKNGRISDVEALEQTEFHDRLKKGTLHLPSDRQTKSDLNFVFVADEAFGLHPNVLKPYPQSALNHERKIFNYRLSRARRVVDKAFEILSTRFRIFHTTINLRTDKIDWVVLACCVLHNFLRRKSSSLAQASTSAADDSMEYIEENDKWTPLEPSLLKGHSDQARQNREKYLTYFNGDGAMEGQNDMMV